MTYCVGILVDDGLVFVSDSRTNAGVDQVATFRKTNTYHRPGERAIVLLSSGNLSITQSVETLLRRAIEAEDESRSLMQVRSLFDGARAVGAALREIYEYDGKHLEAHNTDFNAGLILGGQIKGQPPRLFQIYAAGNFIEATPETTFFQIGETKYGKPVLDRLISRDTSLMTAAKCALVSFDSTMRSNVSVGLPLDLTCYRRDSYQFGVTERIDESSAYFNMIHNEWSAGLGRVFNEVPDPEWEI